MSKRLNYKWGFFSSLKLQVLLTLLFVFISLSYTSQNMMQGSISAIGVNLLTENNQISMVVGDINNGYKTYSSQSISSGFIHCSLIYNLNDSGNSGNGYSIFPNPTSNEIQIVFDSMLKKDHTVRVFDAIGRIVLKSKLLKDTFGLILDFSPFARGVYSVQIDLNGNENILEKIVKK